MLRIVLVEDEIRTRNGLRNIIEKHPDLYTIVAEADNGLKGIEVIKETMPDLVISDIKMPFCDGITMLKNLREEKINTKFILLTGHAEFEYAKAAIKWQVEDYILKPMVVSDLLSALDQVADKLSHEKQKISIPEQIEAYLKFKKGSIDEIKNNMGVYFSNPNGHIRYTMIYISTPLKAYKDELMAITEDFFKDKIEANIIIKIGDQKILIMSKTDQRSHQPQDLQTLNNLFREKFTEEIGLTYVYSDCFDTIIEDTRRLDEKLHYFLAMGTQKPLFIDEITPSKSIKKDRVIELEKDFIEGLYQQNYKQCQQIISMLIGDLREWNYGPGDMLHVFHSLFNQLNQHRKDVMRDMAISSYDRLLEELSSGKTTSDILAPFREILTLLQNKKSASEPYSLLVQKAVTIINNDYMNSITLKEIADSLGVTHVYLSQLFHKEVKKSFTEYTMYVRMTHAKKLLKDSNLKIYEIALKVGYSDPKYFCTQFKKYTGLSPSRYQKA